MQAIILAAGKGERLRPLTLKTPKPLIKVHGKPLIVYHIENLAKAGIQNIVINVSWLAQSIINHLQDGSQWGVSIKYSHEGEEPMETGGGIFNALPLLDSTKAFLVVNGDIKTDFDFSLLNSIQPEYAHLILVENPKHHPLGDFSLSDDGILHFNDSEPKYTYSGMGVYSQKLFQDQSSGSYKLAPILRDHMDSQLITGQKHSGFWQDIGTIESLENINSKPLK